MFGGSPTTAMSPVSYWKEISEDSVGMDQTGEKFWVE